MNRDPYAPRLSEEQNLDRIAQSIHARRRNHRGLIERAQQRRAGAWQGMQPRRSEPKSVTRMRIAKALFGDAP